MPESIRVLHVDDDRDFAELASTFLERESDPITVTTEYDAEAGLDTLESGAVDCIVSDYDMPKVNGLEFLKSVREEFPELPFILFTGKGSEEIADEALTAGATDYFRKESGTSQYGLLATRIENAVTKHQAERRLQRQKEEYRRLFEEAPVMYLVTRSGEVEPVIEDCNQRFLDRLGYERAEVVGEPVGAFYTADSRESLLDGGGYERATTGEFTTEARSFVSKDGTVVDTMLRAVPRTNEHGEVVGTLSLYIEEPGVADRSEELSEYSRLLNEAGDAFYALDSDGRVRTVNDRFVSMLGTDREELVGEHASTVMDNGDVETAETAIKRLLENGDRSVATVEPTFQSTDGHAIPCEVTLTPRQGDDGEFLGTVGVARELSDRTPRRQELERYERIVQAMGDGLYAMDADGRYIEVNDRLLELTGYDRAEIEGAGPSKFHDEADIERFESAIGRLLDADEETVETVESTIETAEGDTLPIEVNLTLLPREEGEFRGTIGIVRDITERTQRERELEVYETVVEATDDAIAVTDREGDFVIVNEAFARAVGTDQDELVGASADILTERGILPDDDSRDLPNVFDATQVDEYPSDRFELDVDSPEFGERTIEVRVTAVQDAVEEPLRVFIARDITARKEREQELEHYETLINTMPDTVVVTDDEGRHVALHGHQGWSGYTTDELLGEHVSITTPEEDIEKAEEALSELISNDDREKVIVEQDLVTKDGEAIPHENHLTLLPPDDDGTIPGAMSVLRDISARKEREKRLSALHEATRRLILADDPDEVAEIVTDTTRDIIGLPINAVMLYDDEANALVPAACTADAEALLGEMPTITPDDDGVWAAFEAGEHRVHRDVEAAGQVFFADPSVRSELLLPLGEYGVLLVGATTEDAFDEHDVSLANVLAANVETALERTRQQQALEERERELELYETAVESALDGIAIMDSNGEFIMVNEVFAAAVGSTPEDLVGVSVAEGAAGTDTYIDSPDNLRDRYVEAYQEAEEEGQSEFRYETTVELVTGPTVLDNRVTAVKQDDGSIVFVLIIRDISEQIDRQRRIETLHGSTRDLMAADTTEEIAHVVSHAVETVLDYPVNVVRYVDDDEACLRPVDVSDAARDVLGERDPYPIDDHPIGEAFRRGEPLIIDDVRERTDAFEDSGIRTVMAVPIGSFGCLTIAHEGIEAYGESDVQLAEILTANAEAAINRVEYEEALRTRERELTRQNERLDEFASIISHDLRNPLNVAEGYFDLVAEDCESEHIEQVRTAHDRMQTLIEDVLTLAREGQIVDTMDPVDVNALVGEYEDAIVEGAIDVETDDLIIQADEGRLRQLLENLFRNARDHVGQGVAVRVGRLEDGFYVEDDGPGIPAEEREEIFEPGYSTREEGTGFGLNIVKEIAEAHGWSVRVAEGADGGARFEVTGVDWA